MSSRRSGLCVLFSLFFIAGLHAADDNRPAIVGVAHIALRTNDMSAAEQFYGHALGYGSFEASKPEAGPSVKFFKVNDHQYIEILPGLNSEEQDRLDHIAFETEDAPKLRSYLANRNVKVPSSVERDSEGNLSFRMKDPEDHEIEFVQYMKGSVQTRQFGKLLPDSRIAKRMIHVGLIIHDRAAVDALYRDILGFQVMWVGGKTEDRVDYVDMRSARRKRLAGVHAQRQQSNSENARGDASSRVRCARHSRGLEADRQPRLHAAPAGEDRSGWQMATKPIRSEPDTGRDDGVQAGTEAVLLSDAFAGEDSHPVGQRREFVLSQCQADAQDRKDGNEQFVSHRAISHDERTVLAAGVAGAEFI